MSDKWKPKGKQKKLLEAAMTPGLNRTITALCKEAGIKSRQTFYNWIEKDENFREAWNSVWEWSIDMYMPSIVSAQVKEAQGGSTPAANYLANLSGKMKRQLTLNTEGDIILRMSGVDEEDV
jgi:hypothetical protein